jgi:ABC-type lipoprotein release transport system permease subunit
MPNRLSHKFTLLGVAALLTMGSISAAAADRCEQRVRKAEMQLQQAEQRHGEHSRQAESKRRKLEQVRANCHNHR